MKTGIMAVITILIIALIGGVIGFLINSPDNPLGSVQNSSEYHATTTAANTSAATYTIFTGPGTLGSLVVASSSGSTFTILDANGTTATTTAAIFKASVAEGTYTFDRVLLNGLLITVPAGFNGNYITTYR